METVVPNTYASDGKAIDNASSKADATPSQVQDWLSQVGLGETNPFELLDAGADPDLNKYLVRHDVFQIIWKDSPSIVFAPAGGGKSAFRVRLSYACRVGEDKRQVFAVPYIAPEPTATSLATHLNAILKCAAQELLLTLVYRPARFEALNQAGREKVRHVLDWNSPGLLRQFLPQIERAGGLAPLVETFAPSAAHLPAPPNSSKVRAMCAALEQISAVHETLPVSQRFQDLIHLLTNLLNFKAIHLLVDGVDAFLETVSDLHLAAMVLEPLLKQTDVWTQAGVFLKLFLPLELRHELPNHLTKGMEIAIIDWKPGALVEVLHARLRAASRGAFDSLDAISAPSLRDAETELLQIVPPIPRELLVLMNRVVEEHVDRVGPAGGLEPEDVEAAKTWYRHTKPHIPFP